ncbi:MAG: methylated-DNA--[protein]-cysteine S-methyltransferase [Flavobacteriales bacterium]|nr:methylated-DNA--[protein]-cysteine S-methyltransferase [Flavobacteriales bacterium]
MTNQLHKLFVAHVPSPIGLLRIETNAIAITRIDFVNEVKEEEHQTPLLNEAKLQLHNYFVDSLEKFTVPLQPRGTHFQLTVWDELVKIPFGKTNSYADIANKLGDVNVIRAAASANGKNPIPIIIPCHRVMGKHGSLIGYSGGLWRKKWLFNHELKGIQPYLFGPLTNVVKPDL